MDNKLNDMELRMWCLQLVSRPEVPPDEIVPRAEEAFQYIKNGVGSPEKSGH